MKIRMIYLAAGNSRRFGSNKLYYDINGKPMFQWGLDVLCEVLKKREDVSLTVVTTFAPVREYVKEMQKLWKGRICSVDSPGSIHGISHSIRAGLTDPDADYYLFSVADQPWMRAETVLELISRTVEGGFGGGCVEWNGISGNPAIFSKELLPGLLMLEGDNGGKKILQTCGNICRVLAEMPEEVQDVDTECNIGG